MKITSEKVKEYMEWRSGVKFRHCPIAVADACNEMIEKLNGTFGDDNITAKDFMKLLFFNDPRNIIQTLKNKYYEYKGTN